MRALSLQAKVICNRGFATMAYHTAILKAVVHITKQNQSLRPVARKWLKARKFVVDMRAGIAR
jgi:hypothetical protein